MLKADFRAWTDALERILPITLVGMVWLLSGVWTPFGGILLFGSFYLIRNIRRFKQAEARRQAALAAPTRHRPLATDQPLPSTEVLPVPSIITERPGWLLYILVPPVALLSALILPLLGAPERVLHPTVQFLTISLLLTVALTILGLLSHYQRIEVQAEQLTVRSAYRHRAIGWREARLFALDGAINPKEPASSYELSGATTIVRWSRQTSRSASRLVQLGRSYEEYDRHMTALLSFIAAKTSLPLCDLRSSLSTEETQQAVS